MTCEIPSQEFKNGFCYDKCPEGYTGDNAGMCLENCPGTFKDFGTTCEPPSILRKTTKTYITPCQSNQIDRNGNCFEPQTVTTVTINGQQVPKIVGCGCNRKTFTERISCPSGFVVYNNECVSECPQGYVDIRDADNNISSIYCMAPCPLRRTNGNTRWPYIGGQCVKDYISRTSHRALMSTEIPIDGLPSTMASFLASKGSSLNSRYRYGQSISDSLGANPSTNPFASLVGTSWEELIGAPDEIIALVVIIVVLIYVGPTLFPLLAKGVGYLFAGIGIGVGSVTSGVGKVAGSTLEVTADLERTSGLAAERRAIERLTAAQAAAAAAPKAPQAAPAQD